MHCRSFGRALREASRIVDEAVKSAEVALLGWTEEEVEKAQGQACLAFDFGGHDMQPRTDDRYLLHLAAWLESMEDDDSATLRLGEGMLRSGCHSCANTLQRWCHPEEMERRANERYEVLEEEDAQGRLIEFVGEPCVLQYNCCGSKRINTWLAIHGEGPLAFFDFLPLCSTASNEKEAPFGPRGGSPLARWPPPRALRTCSCAGREPPPQEPGTEVVDGAEALLRALQESPGWESSSETRSPCREPVPHG